MLNFRRRIALWIAAVAAVAPIGCAAMTNPTSDGIPVRRLPAEVLGRPREEMKPIPLTLLRQKEPDAYRLDKGDVLAVIASEVFGGENVQAPVKLADQFSNNSALGFPIPVQDDGSISLPNGKIKPFKVKGMTLRQVEEQILDRISGNHPDGADLIKRDQARVSVQLMQPRKYKVMVVREDTQPIQTNGGGGAFTGTKKGNGFTIFLEAYRNDILNALNATGGPPGLDAVDEVIIERGTYDPTNPDKGIVRIPLRKYNDVPLTIKEEDIILKDGDILKIVGRDTEVYYTAGVIGSRQWPLPRDYDLKILEALTIAGAPIVNGGFTQNAFVAQAFATGLGTPSPSLASVLRTLPNGQQVTIRVDLDRALRDPRENIRIMPKDFVVLQELPGSAVVRYMTQTFRFSNTQELARTSTFNSTLGATIP
jgi:protein involved in polysaccharide export with SLBB domain